MKSKKGEEATQMSFSTIISAILGVAAILIILAFGLKISQTLFGESSPTPGMLTTYDTIKEIFEVLEDKEFVLKLDKEPFDYRNCLIPFEATEDYMMVALNRDSTQVKITTKLFGFVPFTDTIKRPRYCRDTTTCFMLCSDDECEESEIYEHKALSHVKKMILNKKFNLVVQPVGATILKQMKMTITGSNPNFVAHFEDAQTKTNLRSCLGLRDELKDKRGVFERIKYQKEKQKEAT